MLVLSCIYLQWLQGTKRTINSFYFPFKILIWLHEYFCWTSKWKYIASPGSKWHVGTKCWNTNSRRLTLPRAGSESDFWIGDVVRISLGKLADDWSSRLWIFAHFWESPIRPWRVKLKACKRVTRERELRCELPSDWMDVYRGSFTIAQHIDSLRAEQPN